MALRSDNKPRKIILTTDGDLIKDGVQSIDDEFLEWFVKNPSCEEAKVEITEISCIIPNFGDVDKYRIAIPKQESKTAWVGVLHDKLNEYHPAEYELKDIYQGEGCLPNFPDEELCQIWCDSKYKEVPKQEQDKNKYGVEDMLLAFETGRNFQLTGENNFKELIEQLKK
jgi:hypothetical protein